MKKTNIDKDWDNEISWHKIKIVLIIELVFFILLFIFGNIFEIDILLTNCLNLNIDHHFIKYILINFIFILLPIDGVCILKYRQKVILSTLFIISGIIYIIVCFNIYFVIAYIVLGINLVSLILFLIFIKNMTLFKYLIMSLLPFMLIISFLVFYALLFLSAILIAIGIIISAFNLSPSNSRTQLEKNKGYIDDSTINTKWVDEFGKEHAVENYNKEEKSFEYEGVKYEIKD